MQCRCRTLPLRCGPQEKTLGIPRKAGAVGRPLPGRADGCPSAPHRPARAQCTHAVPQAEPPLPLRAVPWGAGDTLGERSVSLVSHPHQNAPPDVACPPVGRLGLRSPRAAVRCDATTATGPSQGPSLWRSFPDTLRAPHVRGVPRGLVVGSKRPDHARAVGHPVLSSAKMWSAVTQFVLRDRNHSANGPNRKQLSRDDTLLTNGVSLLHTI